MVDWFTVIICLLIGFLAGRAYGIFNKFLKYLEKQKEESKV